jgi:hypothetical protein
VGIISSGKLIGRTRISWRQWDMKKTLHGHLVECRLCQLEQGVYCHAVSVKTADSMRDRMQTDPDGFADYVTRVIHERITGKTDEKNTP